MKKFGVGVLLSALLSVGVALYVGAFSIKGMLVVFAAALAWIGLVI